MDFPTTRSTLDSSNNSCGSYQLVIKEETDLRTAIPIVLTVIALTNNLLVMFLVFCTKQLRKNINFYIVNMAVSDMITSLVISLRYVVLHLHETHGIPVINDIICKIFNYFKSLGPMVSLLTLLAISSDRYRAVLSPVNVTNIPKPCFASLVLLTWVIPGSIFVYEAVLSEAVLSEHIPGKFVCNRITVYYGATESMIFATSLIVFLYVCLIVVNIQILRKLRQSTASLSGLNVIERRKRNRKFLNAVRMVLCSLVLYILCTSPGLAARVVFPIWRESFCTTDMSAVLSVLYNLLIANAALGPVIYFIFLQDFREAFKKRVHHGICWVWRVGPATNHQQNILPRQQTGRSVHQNNPVFEPNDEK